MIGRLRGTVAGKNADRVLLDVAGVGYEIAVPPRSQQLEIAEHCTCADEMEAVEISNLE